MKVKNSSCELMKIISPYDDWFADGASVKNDEAEKALFKFLTEYKKCMPDKKYQVSQSLHSSYLIQLLKIREALIEGNYQRACNEIITLNHNELIFQRRIYANLIRLLEDNINTENLNMRGGD